MWNPSAINRVFRFVWRRQDRRLSDPGLSLLVARMRLTLHVVVIGWLVLLCLLVAIIPGRAVA